MKEGKRTVRMQKPKNYHHSNIPSPLKKPKPTIQKITFSKEEQDDINALLEGKPTKDVIERQQARGISIEKWLKNRVPSTAAYRIKIVKQKYKIGLCHVCQDFPLYKLTWKLDGINLVEYYCEKHFDKII